MQVFYFVYKANVVTSNKIISYNIFTDSPQTKPMIYAISPTTVRPGENIQVKCNLTSLGYPTISWRWFCDNQAPSYGTTIELETYFSLNVNNRSIGCRCRGTSSSSYSEYDEFSNLVQFLVFRK